MDRLSYLYLLEDMWRGIFTASEVALKPKVRLAVDHGCDDLLGSAELNAELKQPRAHSASSAGYHQLSV